MRWPTRLSARKGGPAPRVTQIEPLADSVGHRTGPRVRALQVDTRGRPLVAAVKVRDGSEVVVRYDSGYWQVMYGLSRVRYPLELDELDNAVLTALDTAYIIGGEEVHDEFEV